MPNDFDNAPTLHSAPSSEPTQPVQRIGRYVVLSELGAGAMGRVYAAYDPELDRKVAVKTLKFSAWGDDSSSGQARLLREAQAMAKLSHPNVVPVHDAGTFDQGVFLAMELVEGETLANWIARRRHPWREVVRIFTDAGRGLAAAHAAGLIHRDFKPANVLIGLDRRARVTDFGLARADEMEAPPAEDAQTHPGEVSGPLLATPLTIVGSVMGTPGYMSPEQYVGKEVSAQTDQFAFCASLFEALYGTRAFRGPSTVELAEQARKADISPRPRDARVPARLERVALKGMSPDPAARYPTMDAVVAELSKDPSARARRIAAVGIAALLLAGAGFFGRASLRERTQLCQGGPAKLAGLWDATSKEKVRASLLGTGMGYAPRTWEVVQQGLDAYATAWLAGFRDACEAGQLRGEQSARVMDLRMACLTERREELGALTTRLAAADAKIAENAVLAVAALGPLERCADVAALSQPVPMPSDAAARASIQDLERKLAIARSTFALGRYAETLGQVKALVDPVQRANYPPLLAQVLGLLARAESASDADQDAVATYQAAYAAAQAAHRDDLAARDLMSLARVLSDPSIGKTEEARILVTLAKGGMQRFKPEQTLEADWHDALGEVAGREGKVGEAIAEYERTLALREPLKEPLAIAEALFSLGRELANKGDLPRARAAVERAMGLREGVLGRDHPLIINSLSELSRAELERANFDDAIAYLVRAKTLTERAFGSTSVRMCKLHNNLANALETAERGPEAVEEASAALETCEKVLPKDSPALPVVRMVLGNSLRVAGRLSDAVAEHTGAIHEFERVHATQPPSYCQSLTELGRDHLAQKKAADALRSAEAAADCFKAGQTQGLLAAEALQLVGRAQLALGRAKESVGTLQKALEWELASKAAALDLADIQFPLAQAVWSTDPARARELADAAEKAYQAQHRARSAREVAAWRGNHR